MELRLQLLGPPQVLVGDEPLDVDTRKATALLIYLSVTGEVHRRETMAALFWPESDGPRAKAALRRTLSTLRKGLNGRWLEADREVLSLSADRMDCTQFRVLVESTRDHDHPGDRGCTRCIEPLSAAAELYRGDFLQGFSLPDSPEFDDWQYFNLLAFQRLLAEALQRLSAIHQERMEFEVAAEYANRLLGLDPLNESAHRSLMSIYARSGNRQLALRQYQDCVRVLQEEIGAPPLDETVELNERIVAGELEDYATDRATPVDQSVPQAASLPETAPQLPLVAREAQLAEMLAWYQGISTAPRALAVVGEQGIGKSRLLSEFAHRLATDGARLISSRCYPGEASYAYRPWIDGLRAGMELPEAGQRLEQLPELWLAEAARLMPELSERFPGLEKPPIASRSTGQDRFLEALVQVSSALLDGPRPGVLLLDDLHWGDEASLDFLIYLLRHATQPILVLVGWRTEGLAGEQQLRELMARLPRNRSKAVSLERLSSDQVEQLAGKAGLGDPAVVEALYRETEGLPLFVAEYLGAVERGDPEHTPPTIRQAIDGRLNALSGTGKQLLSTAAVIGRSFEFETLRMISGRSLDETVAGLEELIGAGTIREHASGTPRLGPAYDFVHEKLREVALEGTTQARQRLLHGRTASALTRLQGHRQSELLADRIAHHLLRAGDEAGAAAMYLQAAEHARSVYANEEALAHFRSALALSDQNQTALHEAIGDLLTLLGRYDEALRSYEAAGALRPEQEPAARIEHKLGALYQRWGRWERARNHFAAAAELAQSDAERARIHADWSLTAHRQGDTEQADRLVQQALKQAQAADDPGALAQCHNILGIFERARGEIKRALKNLQHSLEYADQLSDPGARSAALNNLSLALAQDGQLEQALQAARQALEISESLGDRHRAAALHSNLADVLHQAGERQQAQEQLTASAELFAAVGVDTGEYEPEIWKLVEW